MEMIYYVIHDNITGDDTAAVGTWDDFHRDTFSPEANPTYILRFKISGRTYAERKADLQNKAIEFSHNTAPGLYWSDEVIIQDFFETNGRRYGLLTEFRENAIC